MEKGGQGEVGAVGEMARAAGNTWPQHCPPTDLSPSPLRTAINGGRLFSYCFVKHYEALFIAVSPDSYSMAAAALSTAPDRSEKVC